MFVTRVCDTFEPKKWLLRHTVKRRFAAAKPEDHSGDPSAEDDARAPRRQDPIAVHVTQKGVYGSGVRRR